MNSWRHALSSSRKWGGTPEDYLPIHSFIDSSKQTLGDHRHRALYHHTLGVWLCQQIFGPVLRIPRTSHATMVEVPVRVIAERHIIEDLGWLPTPQAYLKNMPVETWMSGARRRELPVSHILNAANQREEESSDRSE